MMSTDQGNLIHYGAKGMRWGIRKPKKHEQTDNKDFKRQIKKGAVVVGSVLAVSGAVAVTIAVQRNGKAKEAADFAQSLRDVPFAWKDGAGQWHQYV